MKRDYEQKLGIAPSKPLPVDGAVAVEESTSELEKEVTRLRAVLSAHGIAADGATAVITPTDAKITQLLAQVLKVPMGEITPALIEPLVNALSEAKLKPGALIVEEHKENAGAATSLPISDVVPMEE